MRWFPDGSPRERRTAAILMVAAGICWAYTLVRILFHWPDTWFSLGVLVVSDVGFIAGVAIIIRARNRDIKASGAKYPLVTRASALWTAVLILVIVTGFFVMERVKHNF